MSMDELHAQIERFIFALDQFNGTMGKNWDELQRAWESADELWHDDSTRRQFESQWSEMGNALRTYRNQSGEEYLRFLLERRRALDEYFSLGG